MKFCSKCGFKLLSESRFCSQCGRPINQVPQVPKPPIPPVKPITDCLLVLECTQTKGLKFNYVFILFYYDKLIINITPSKQMEKQIYAAMKEEKKRRKMSLIEQTGYRKVYFKQWIQRLMEMPDQQIMATSPLSMILPMNHIHKCQLQFQKTTVYHGEDDSSMSKTQGTLEIYIGDTRYKYVHGYTLDQSIVGQLNNLFQNRFNYRS